MSNQNKHNWLYICTLISLAVLIVSSLLAQTIKHDVTLQATILKKYPIALKSGTNVYNVKLEDVNTKHIVNTDVGVMFYNDVEVDKVYTVSKRLLYPLTFLEHLVILISMISYILTFCLFVVVVIKFIKSRNKSPYEPQS
jgi:hypothetical protein